MEASATGTIERLGPFRLLLALVADVFVVLWTLIICITVIVLLTFTKAPWVVDFFGPFWARGIKRICGMQVEVVGLEHVDPRRSCVLVSNHASNTDIFATAGSLPLNVRFVAKKELTRLPFFGQALQMSDHVVIDRANPEQAIERINQRVRQSGSKPLHILFYAEGTRSPDGTVREFKSGAVNLAIRTGLPIVPLSISGTRKFMPRGSLLLRPGGKVKIVLAAPIETAGVSLDDRDALNQRVRRAVIANLIENY